MRPDFQEILYHSHHISQNHMPMSRSGRASKFSPFKAFDGHEETISEEGRLTNCKHEISEDAATALNQVLSYLLEHQYEEAAVKLTYFKPDVKKEDGSYMEYRGVFKYYREDIHCLVFMDGKEISVEDIERIVVI